ncbi:MAG TPA: alkaline phosphatase D family protein [Pirellulaceae bacterium]|nr:alkaline phosphatase D family protein [Pirellulaceae bacterium]HMO93648.1 alkaline phosphatase D family protein [Pirellulaceae bacterium]HMP70652.1 alkaline phosphatase D family protein [Pirellulaceae bacterium]
MPKHFEKQLQLIIVVVTFGLATDFGVCTCDKISNQCFGQDSQAQTTSDETSYQELSSLQGLPSRIAFGSCGHQDKPQPILDQVIAAKSDLFIYLGDNIYGDTRDMQVLKSKYDKLGAKPEFQRLRRHCPVLAIWDNHDYGENDAGNEYPMKRESREIFLDFWRVPIDDAQRQNEGIYGVHRFKSNAFTMQVILLDTRFFRDSLKRNPRPLPQNSPFKNEYQPLEDPQATLLGEAQWKWLANVFAEPADLRVICSSIQFGHEYNGWESWTNLPLEQQKMLDLIQEHQAHGVVFISGDVHWGEISHREIEGLYPIYDITASGITETWPTIEPNKYRVGEPVRENHFGMIEINWDETDPSVTFKLIDVTGKLREAKSIKLSDLRL